jgi:hypothetical protein
MKYTKRRLSGFTAHGLVSPRESPCPVGPLPWTYSFATSSVVPAGGSPVGAP